MTYNLKDLDRLAAEIAAVDGVEGEEEKLSELLQKYTGPGTGLEYDEDAKKMTIADTFAPDLNGDILNIEMHTGPATGMVLKDGVIQPA